MSFRLHREGELEYLTSDVLDGAAHCFSTRFGGVSEGALASLNLGTHRGDRPENVLENYARLGRAVGFAPEETVFTKQVHSALVERVGRADCGRGLQREAEHGVDGLVTNEPGVALTIFSADCTPVLLFDPVARAIGAAHAGWRGTAAGIAARAGHPARRGKILCRPEAAQCYLAAPRRGDMHRHQCRLHGLPAAAILVAPPRGQCPRLAGGHHPAAGGGLI